MPVSKATAAACEALATAPPRRTRLPDAGVGVQLPRTLDRVTLPPPTSCNDLHGVRPDGVRYTTRQYRDWQNRVVPLLRTLKKPPLPARLCVALLGRWNPNRDGGANLLKALEDAAVKAGVIPDDSLRYLRSWGMEYAEDAGEARVVLWFEGV